MTRLEFILVYGRLTLYGVAVRLQQVYGVTDDTQANILIRFSYHNYSWIAILVNVPATFFVRFVNHPGLHVTDQVQGTAYYEFLMRDSLQKISKGHAVHEHGDEGLERYLTSEGIMENGISASAADVHKITSNGH